MNDEIRQELKNRYRVEIGQRLGAGGFGEVFRARTEEGVPCAIKVSLERLDASSEWVAKELRGLDAVKTITDHPRICALFDIYPPIQGHLVTRWQLGEASLADQLAECRRQGLPAIPLDELLGHMVEAAEGIDFLNRECGIYHRDIKPENLLLFHGHVKLADLGLAKFAGESTRSHTGSGTLGYMPPEGWEEHRLTASSDVYSLAATYLRLRTGRNPFGDNARDIILRQEAGQPAVDGLDEAEATLLRRTLARDPKSRPQDGAAGWVAQLSETLGVGGVPVRRAAGKRPMGAAGIDLAPVAEPGMDAVVAIPAHCVSNEIERFSIGTLEIMIEPVTELSDIEPEAASVPGGILAMQRQIRAIEQTIATLRNDTHPALAPAKDVLDKARSQWLRLRSAFEQSMELIPRDLRSHLAAKLSREPHMERHRLCDLAPQVAGSAVIAYAGRWRDSQFARQILDRVVGQYGKMREHRAAELEQQCGALRGQLLALQEEDLRDVIRASVAALRGTSVSCVDAFGTEWPKLEAALTARGYPWDLVTIRDKAEKHFRTAYDERVWSTSEGAGTIDAYLAYLDAVPAGGHDVEARNRLAVCAYDEYLGRDRVQLGRPKTKKEIAELLRKRLLGEMGNVRLRKCYLALRPRMLKTSDVRRALLRMVPRLAARSAMVGGVLGVVLALFLCLLGDGQVQFPVCVIFAVVGTFISAALVELLVSWADTPPVPGEHRFSAHIAWSGLVGLVPHVVTSVAIGSPFTIGGLISWNSGVSEAGCWAYGILGGIGGFGTLANFSAVVLEPTLDVHLLIGGRLGPMPFAAYRRPLTDLQAEYLGSVPSQSQSEPSSLPLSELQAEYLGSGRVIPCDGDQVRCSKCGRPIQRSTFERNDGQCRVCRKRKRKAS